MSNELYELHAVEEQNNSGAFITDENATGKAQEVLNLFNHKLYIYKSGLIRVDDEFFEGDFDGDVRWIALDTWNGEGFYRKPCYVATLIAEVFELDKPSAKHNYLIYKDNNRKNCALSNLVWGTKEDFEAQKQLIKLIN
ncbi:hypothetical protein [Bacillus paranthracis]|uniref:hypothetical protein n=1 Tax=Bacillus paranthracis TaxID=2026186 RepID=UPI003D651858